MGRSAVIRLTDAVTRELAALTLGSTILLRSNGSLVNELVSVDSNLLWVTF